VFLYMNNLSTHCLYVNYLEAIYIYMKRLDRKIINIDA
jgi:hypothetical protein